MAANPGRGGTPALTPCHLALFGRAWAVAALFHVWVNPRSGGFLEDPSATGWSHVVVVAAAVAVLARPRGVGPLAVLCGAIVVSAYLEAPFVGNHWVLAALVSVAFLATRDQRFLPVARATTLVFYGFAAFAKLNTGFFSTERSCAVFFFDQAAASWGRAGRVTGDLVSGRVVIVLTVLVELAIPVLLLVRRTRHAGVVLGLLFHFVIALNRTHPFADFSAGLDALLLVFLPRSFSTHVTRVLARTPRAVFVTAGAGAAVVTAALMAPASTRGGRVLDEGRDVLWFTYGMALLVTVVAWVWHARRSAPSRRLVGRLGWLWVVPVIAVVNGVTPYVEVKTGYGWNMYANLVTVDGEGNHLVVRRTLPLTDQQDELVTILASSDQGLQWYADHGWLLAWPQFRAHLAQHPAVSIRYARAGTVHDLARAADDAALVAPVPTWRQKLLLFRAVDSQDPPRCQDVWGPAR
ncbi:MAG: hypothetical protein ACRD0U_10850 [Acidimicrobiales bacterium]